MSNDFYVYAHMRKDTRKIFYIGKGRERRVWRQSGRNNLHWSRIVDKYGYYAEILFKDLTEERALLLETQLIAQIGRHDTGKGPLCNHTDGGEGTTGSRHTEEAKARMAASKRGKKRRAFSEEHREKLAAAGKGRIHNAEARAKISATHKGKLKSEAHRQKISEAKRGTICSEETKAKLKGRQPRLGKTLSAESRKKISESRKGFKFTPEEKAARRQRMIERGTAGNRRNLNPSLNPVTSSAELKLELLPDAEPRDPAS